MPNRPKNYCAPRMYHMAHKFKQDNSGDVSALCFKRPRKIDMQHGRVAWTLRPESVTCPKCLEILGDEMNTVDNFHDHLDACEQCREHPLDLCGLGTLLLAQVVKPQETAPVPQPGAEAGQPSTS